MLCFSYVFCFVFLAPNLNHQIWSKSNVLIGNYSIFGMPNCDFLSQLVINVKIVLCFGPFHIVTWHNWLAKILQILFRTVVSVGPSMGYNSKYRMQKYESSCHMKTDLLLKMWRIDMTVIKRFCCHKWNGWVFKSTVMKLLYHKSISQVLLKRISQQTSGGNSYIFLKDYSSTK